MVCQLHLKLKILSLQETRIHTEDKIHMEVRIHMEEEVKILLEARILSIVKIHLGSNKVLV